MEDHDITMEEYIQLETKKALRHGQVPYNFIIKNLYVSLGILFNPKLFYKDDACTSVVEAKIKKPLRRLCHRFIAFTIAGRGQAPKKVTTTDLFFLRSMDEGMSVNVSYLLAYYMIRHASGRKRGARMSGVRLRICDRLGDVVTWVAMGPKRQQVGVAHVEKEDPQEGVQADPAPAHAPQMPQPAATVPRTVPQRL
nr:hypothetical protein [Tanacetum cinerariifolium]